LIWLITEDSFLKTTNSNGKPLTLTTIRTFWKNDKLF